MTVVENARSNLESEIATLRSSSTSSESELNSLKSRIASLETSNRDTLALLEAKTSAYDKLSEELSATHKKTVDLRRELSTAEQNLQAANSAAATARFREQSLQQELELTKKNNEFFEGELKAKSAEYLKFRKEKNARIAELQRELEEASATIDSLRRSENTLKSRLDEIEQKYEEALATIQSVKEESISTTEQLRIELDSANRLAELQGAAAATAKQRVQECQLALEKSRDDAAEEISRLRVEIETEHADKEAAERKVAELEARISQLESQGLAAASAASPGANGSATPLRPGTPVGTFSPRASKGKGGLTMTQLYSEYDKMRTMLAAEQRTNAELKATLDEMVQDLESKKPEIDELRADHARLENAVVEMSNILENAGKERDEATREARKWRGQVEGLTKESEILRQQLRDLSAQVKVLVLEVALAKEGESEYDREELEKIARKEIDDSMANQTPTGRFITQNLTTFKDLHELQEQNVTLRRMLRELGDRMESAEARQRDATYLQEQEELKELRIRVQTFRDEIANLTAQAKSYVKERDTFRAMLMRRNQAAGDNAAFSQSVPLGSAPPAVAQSADGTDYAELLRQVQAHFDTFRQETATDHAALRQQVNELTRRNSELMSEIGRLNGQLAAAAQRAELLQNNFNMLKNENTEIQKRYSALLENANRQDIKTQQAAEDLVEARGLVDSLQRENANLKAEKDLWKNIEKRLIEDNESLRNERSRLDSLNANLQNILNEREHTDAESRRRLQHTIESLESELQSTKRKLNEEIEEGKRAALRREYEHEQNQKRIDDLVASLSSTREELISAKTTRDHLQAKVDELTVELRSAEERLQVLQSRPSHATPAAAATSTAAEATAPAGDSSGLTREQELAIEVSELKRDLELARAELEHAKEQVEDYKAISQATEERLQSVTETQEQYREETEQLVEEKNKKIKDLETRVEEITTELSNTNSELSKLRDEQGDTARRLEEQKNAYESEITRLKEEAERQVAAAQFHQEDLKAQAEIAQRAQQNYENELVKHAEAAKQLQTVRAEANALRLEMADIKTQAENHRKDLEQKEESWKELRDRYEREIADLHKRREEVMHQNTLLHNQLENITKQISALQKDRAQIAEGEEETEGASTDLESLQEVIKFLRREKEIVDVQYHLATQESKRLQQQLNYTQAQLDDTRLKLEQQRRAAADSEHHALSHNKLVETLNELNLFRESSVTLRNQVKQADAAVAEKTARIEELERQIEPLETRVQELENIVETKDEEMKLLQTDRDRWQQRTENILQKYDRVDPAEMEALKEKLAALEKERDEAVSERDKLKEETASFPVQLKQAEDRTQELRAKLTEQFKARSKELSGRIQAKQAELNAVVQEKEVIQEELRRTREELNQLKLKQGEAQQAPSEVPAPSADAATSTTPSAQPAGPSTPADAARIKELEETVKRLEAALAEKESQFDAKLKERSDKMKELYNSKLAEMRNNHRQELEQLKAQQQQQQQAAESGAATPATTSKTEAKTEAGELPELTDAQARDLVAKNKTVQSIVRQNIQTQVNKLKQQLQQEAAQAAQNQEATSKAIADLEQKFNAEKEQLKKSYEEATEEKIRSAIELNDKKSAVKMSMLETRSRNAAAKLQVVQKAAQETPEKPVGEVWEVAKDAKAPVAAKPPQTQAQSPAQAQAQAQVAQPQEQTQPQTQPQTQGAQPQGAQAAPQPGAQPSEPAPAETPAQAAQDTKKQQEAQKPAEEEQPAAGQPAQSTPATEAPAAEQPPAQQQQQQQQQPQQRQQPTQRPSQQRPGGIGHHPQAGQAALRALQSGLPIAARAREGRGGSQAAAQAQSQSADQQQQQQQPASGQRGSGIPRGGGRGGRGGRAGGGGGGQQQQQQQQQRQQQQQQQRSPAAGRGGGLNAQARQFNPQGNKRAREEGEGEGGGATGGKRIRGGGKGQ